MVFMHGLTIASVDCDQESHLLEVTTHRNRRITSRETKQATCGAGGSGRAAGAYRGGNDWSGAQ
jgi:hypothetical protein